tara:strand:- start:1667 stop:2275 length:609 start_codon:yes stop_codon:yes gene_type:complete
MQIKDLATLSGSERVRLALGLDRDQTNKLKLIAQSMVSANPHILRVPVGKARSNTSFYDFRNNKVGIGHKSPEVIAHELGHAISLANSSDFYKSILSKSKKLSNLSNMASFTLAGITALNPKLSKEQKNKLLDIATIGSTAITLPNLYEELKATALATYHSPAKLRTGISLIPGLVSHMSNDLTAPATYLLTKKLLGVNSND